MNGLCGMIAPKSSERDHKGFLTDDEYTVRATGRSSGSSHDKMKYGSSGFGLEGITAVRIDQRSRW